jgi:hypothetical protein
VLTSLAGASYFAYGWHRSAPPPAHSAAPPPKPPPSPDTIADPLLPERPARRDPAPRPGARTDWVKARPGFQYSRPSAERGGANPCNLPAADASQFEPWASLSQGRFTLPKSGAIVDGEFDLVLHFHGDDLARRELIESRQPFVLYALTLDGSESYATPFAGSGFMGQLVAAIEATLSAKHGVKARARHIALSAWSAGFMGVLSILGQREAERVDAVVLSDGLHGARGALDSQVAPFAGYAKRAEAGERFFLITYSSIDPPGFASTTESVHYLLSLLGERPEPVRRDDRFGLELIEYFSHGDFHVRGYAGNDKPDHCAQVTLLRDAYAAIGRRWKKP